MRGGDDDREFGPAVDVIDLDKLDQADLGLIVLDDETALALIVDVLVIQIRQFHKRLIRLLKPVAHHTGIVVQLMDKRQILPLQRAQSDCWVNGHNLPGK